MEFCRDIKKQWRCNEVVFIGDLVDWNSIAFHASNPEGHSALDEFQLTKACIGKWLKVFPKAKICVGNHDARVVRLAESVNIPSKFIRAYAELWGTPKWEWDYSHTIDDVYYFHGTGFGGLHPAFNAARQMSMSVVMGHIHSVGGVKWLVNPHKRWFGMDVGCGCDDDSYAFSYGKHFKRKSVVGCGVVIDSVPYYEIMPLEIYK
jgi:hypothetical protein